MPMFQYSAYGPRGDLANGSIDAASEAAAAELLWAQGLTPFKMRPLGPTGERWWQRELFSRRASSAADLTAFTREFATLSAAEIPLDDVLRILSDQTSSTGMRANAAQLRADVMNGATLSEAMQKQSRLFPPDYVSVVRAGEIGGTVDRVFQELATLLERRMELAARVRSALVYPILLVCLAVVSLTIIIGALVPNIASVFAGSGRPMPPTIGFVLMVQARWPEIVTVIGIILAATVWGGLLALRRPRARFAVDRFLLRAPIMSSLIMQQETARFSRTVGTLLRSGVPLLQASTSARAVLRNCYIANQIDHAVDAVREGTTLHRALENHTKLPAIALRMIAIGEEAGKLDRMLMRIATMFEQQSQRTIDRLMTVLTPFLTLVMAGLVGGLIMTVIDAIMSMNELAYQ
jgi:general secretion pathway protein F